MQLCRVAPKLTAQKPLWLRLSNKRSERSKIWRDLKWQTVYTMCKFDMYAGIELAYRDGKVICCVVSRWKNYKSSLYLPILRAWPPLSLSMASGSADCFILDCTNYCWMLHDVMLLLVHDWCNLCKVILCKVIYTVIGAYVNAFVYLIRQQRCLFLFVG